MLTNVFFDNITEVITQLQDCETIIAVSDGSVRAPHMSYRLIIGGLHGTQIASGYGPADGRPSSVRAKAAGMLAASLFLGMIQKFTNCFCLNLKSCFMQIIWH